MYLEMRIGFLGIFLYVDCLWLDHFYQDLAEQHVQRVLKLCFRNESFAGCDTVVVQHVAVPSWAAVNV